MPPLIILQAPTTPQIIQKIIPKYPQNKNTSNIVVIKPKISTKINAYNDDIDVPTKSGNPDEELLLSSPLPIIEEDSNDINEVSMQEREDYVEKLTEFKHYPFRINHINPERIGEIKTEFRQVQEEENSNVKFWIVIVATVCAIATLGILAGFASVKFRFIQLRNRRMTSGQGHSQSDVRFLTADEVLDFNLDAEFED